MLLSYSLLALAGLVAALPTEISAGHVSRDSVNNTARAIDHKGRAVAITVGEHKRDTLSNNTARAVDNKPRGVSDLFSHLSDVEARVESIKLEETNKEKRANETARSPAYLDGRTAQVGDAKVWERGFKQNVDAAQRARAAKSASAANNVKRAFGLIDLRDKVEVEERDGSESQD
ncbi:unnamed protein product [Discula destructiva]